ncbi:MAG: hypothetical protein ABWY63_04990 [Hyphomicrobiaceae bacterium]|jgi:hypothetical protein
MRQWEYLRLDLNDAPRRGDETGVLNRAGGEGWELVIVSRNGVAILKREIDQPASAGRRKAPDPATG